MFIIREYAVCVIIACLLAGLVLALWGVGYLLKAAGTRFARMLPGLANRMPALKLGAMKFTSKDVIDSGIESSVTADGPS
jgi:hypothetical protein